MVWKYTLKGILFQQPLPEINTTRCIMKLIRLTVERVIQWDSPQIAGVYNTHTLELCRSSLSRHLVNEQYKSMQSDICNLTVKEAKLTEIMLLVTFKDS